MRIKCKTPSTGRAVNLTKANLPTEWTTVVEAPDFSVPDTSNAFPMRDPLDSGRAIRPGEVFMLTPVFARNKSLNACWVETRLLLEDGTVVETPGRQVVPGNDTALIPVQGRSFVKRTPAGANGDRLQLRAQTAATLDVWGSGEEKLSAEHTGVVA